MNHFPVVRSMLPLGKVYAGKVQRWRLAGKRGRERVAVSRLLL